MTETRLLRAIAAPTLAAVVVAVVAVLARSGAPTRESASTARSVRSGHVTVAITNYAFAPAKLTVRAGTVITFTDHDSTAHTATANDGAFNTGTIEPGQSRTIRVGKAGTYPYHCLFHAFMTGTVTVTG